MKQIRIFDTTLRDGEQSPGCSMNLAEKLEMAEALDKLGVDIIEAGFAISSPDDFKSVEAIAKVVKNATVASLARCTKEDIDRAWEAVQHAAHPRIHVFIATSDVHLKHKLQMSREQVIARIKEMVSYAKSKCADIEFSAEDASRSDRKFLVKSFETAIEAGATTLNVPDTVGYAIPQEMEDLIRYLKTNVKGIDDVVISVHCHNDLGQAVACTLASIIGGATQVECTVNGIGERAGNASLEEIVMALKTRKDFFQAETNISTKSIYRTSTLLSAITGVPVAPTKPIVGANAFAHEAGIHQHGDSGVPLWVKILCAIMIALGTSVGGWRIMRTMGSKVTRLAPSGGFVAQTTAAAVIESMTAIGAPVSTTQVITSSIMGVGSSKRLSSVNWGVAQSIAAAWLITLPVTMILGGSACYLLSHFF